MLKEPLQFLIEIFILGLAIWRLSSLLTLEDGPFDIFTTLRMYAGVYDLDEDGRPKGFFARTLDCLWCVSLYLSIIVGFFVFWPDVLNVVMGILATSTMSILIDSKMRTPIKKRLKHG